MYTIRQTKLKKCFFDLIENTQTKEYNFSRYKEALIFALSEQIKFIYSIPCENCKPILKKPFDLYLSEKEFILAARQNPFFYLGVHNFERVNIKKFYYYLINKNKLQKLKKYK